MWPSTSSSIQRPHRSRHNRPGIARGPRPDPGRCTAGCLRATSLRSPRSRAHHASIWPGWGGGSRPSTPAAGVSTTISPDRGNTCATAVMLTWCVTSRALPGPRQARMKARISARCRSAAAAVLEEAVERREMRDRSPCPISSAVSRQRHQRAAQDPPDRDAQPLQPFLRSLVPGRVPRCRDCVGWRSRRG